jgi:hypothetical protein
MQRRALCHLQLFPSETKEGHRRGLQENQWIHKNERFFLPWNDDTMGTLRGA